jgi:hypothetical protein
LFRKLPSVTFNLFGDKKINFHFLKVLVSLSFIDVESGDLRGGFDLIICCIECGLDLVDFKLFGSIFKMMLESVKHGMDLIVKGSSQI